MTEQQKQEIKKLINEDVDLKYLPEEIRQRIYERIILVLEAV